MIKLEIKKLSHGSLVYGIGGVLQRFLGLLLLPFFSRILTPQEYGIMALIGLITTGLNGLFSLGTGSSMSILYYRKDNKTKRPTIIWSTTMFLMAISILLIPFLFIAAPLISQVVFQTSTYALYFRLAFLNLALNTIINPFYSFLQMEEKAKLYVIITLISTVVSLLLTIFVLLVFHWGVLGLFLASLFGQLIMLGIVFLFVARKIPYGVDRKLIAPLVRIGFPSIFGLFAFLLIDYADRQILQRIVGLNVLGVYSVGYSFGMVIMIIVNAFSTAWPPFFMSFINRFGDAKLIFGRVLKYYIIGVGFLVVLFFAFAKPIIIIMVAPPYKEAFVVIGMVASAYMLKGCYLILLPGIYFVGKLKYQSYIEWIAALLNIGLNLWLIPIYGIAGAASATLLSYIALPILAWTVSRKFLLIDYDWQKIGWSIFAIVISSTLIFHISFLNSIISIIIFTSITLSILIVFLVFFAFTKSERIFTYNKIILLLNNYKCINTQ